MGVKMRNVNKETTEKKKMFLLHEKCKYEFV